MDSEKRSTPPNPISQHALVGSYPFLTGLLVALFHSSPNGHETELVDPSKGKHMNVPQDVDSASDRYEKGTDLTHTCQQGNPHRIQIVITPKTLHGSFGRTPAGVGSAQKACPASLLSLSRASSLLSTKVVTCRPANQGPLALVSGTQSNWQGQPGCIHRYFPASCVNCKNVRKRAFSSMQAMSSPIPAALAS